MLPVTSNEFNMLSDNQAITVTIWATDGSYSPPINAVVGESLEVVNPEGSYMSTKVLRIVYCNDARSLYYNPRQNEYRHENETRLKRGYWIKIQRHTNAWAVAATDYLLGKSHF